MTYFANTGTGDTLSEAAQYVRDRWAGFLGWERRLVDMQHRAALAAQAARATANYEQEQAAKAMIYTLGDLNILHGKLVDHFRTLAPYVGLGAIAIPVAVAAGFSALAVAMLWWLRKADLQERLLDQLEAGVLTEAGFLEAQRSIAGDGGPLVSTLRAGGDLIKWAALAFLAWMALQAFGMVRPIKANPPLAIFKSNPGTMSQTVYDVTYRHVDDGQKYIHEFGPDVEMEAQEDGSVRIAHRMGRPVWREF